MLLPSLLNVPQKNSTVTSSKICASFQICIETSIPKHFSICSYRRYSMCHRKIVLSRRVRFAPLFKSVSRRLSQNTSRYAPPPYLPASFRIIKNYPYKKNETFRRINPYNCTINITNHDFSKRKPSNPSSTPRKREK